VILVKLTRYGVSITVSDERGEELLSSSQGYRKVEDKSSTPAPKDEKPVAPKRVRKDSEDK